MADTVMIIISWALSMLVFDFIFNKLNCKYNLFKAMQSKVNNLDEQSKKKLRFISFLLMVLIYGIMGRFEVSSIIQGLVMGILFSFRDLFFENIWSRQV